MPNNPHAKRANRQPPAPTSANKTMRGRVLRGAVDDILPPVSPEVLTQQQQTFVGPASAILESGGATLTIGAIAAGQVLIRSGTTLIGKTVMFDFNNTIVDLTGGGSTKLDGLDAATLPTGYVISFNQVNVGARQFQLQVSALTPSPTVVAALNSASRQWISIL